MFIFSIQLYFRQDVRAIPSTIPVIILLVWWPHSHLQNKRLRRRGKNLFATWWLNPPQSGSVVPGMGSLRVRNQLWSEIAVNQLLMQSMPFKQSKTMESERDQAKEIRRTQWRHLLRTILPTNPGNEPLTFGRNSSNNWPTICMRWLAALHFKTPFPVSAS